MLLSFSLPAMLPPIRAGIREASGETLPEGTRVKRQTMRRDSGPGSPYRRLDDGALLHLWWKSRTPARERLGAVSCRTVEAVFLFYTFKLELQVEREGSRLDTPAIEALFRADGFDDLADAKRFFMGPHPADRWQGFVIIW